MTDNDNVNNTKKLTAVYDKPSRFANPGWRVIYAFAGWLILGNWVKTSSSLFISLIFYFAPLSLDYLKFSPQENWRKMYMTIANFIANFWIIISIVGKMGNIFKETVINDQLFIKVNNFVVLEGFKISYVTIWYLIGISFIFTIIDWAAAYRIGEEIIEAENEKIKERLKQN